MSEPFVRGMSQANLNRAWLRGHRPRGCPNRMDPATSDAATETTDSVTAIRGVETVRHAGGAGGTVS